MPSIGPLITTYNDSGQMEGAGSGVAAEGQSFTLTAGWTVTDVKIQMAKIGSPSDNVLVSVQADSSGAPSGTDIGTVASLAASGIDPGTGSGAVWYTFTVNAPVSSTGTYWVYARRSGSTDASNFIRIEANSAASEYAGGEWKYQGNTGTWNATGGDLSMELIYSTAAAPTSIPRVGKGRTAGN